ncbi:MAG: SpoIID/LytB domain-containing protein [Ilumatobacteraceae bacterium]
MNTTTVPRRTPRWRIVAAVCVAAFLTMCLAISAGGASTTAAAPALPTAVTLVGHGNGHGIGMGQWGAYGYAVDAGWSAWQIVDHYYGGTVHGTAPLDSTVTVRLQGLDGAQTAVVSDADIGAAGSGWRSLVVRRSGASYTVWARTDAKVCPSPSDQLGAPWAQVASGTGTFDVATPTPAVTTDTTQLLWTCRPDGTLRAYRGSLQSVSDSSGVAHTVNVVPVEQYLRAVVAKEMSPSWANAGGGRGLQALAAQAIAGRSYALSEHLYSYATTCDSVCQTYQGAATRSGVGSTIVAVEHPLSDPAVSMTAGMVLLTQAGAPAHTMYAASTGGYTDVNAQLMFPAVPDDGDATALNPNHDWTVTLSAAQIQAAYPSIGTFAGLTVLARNGLGDLGGRVTSIRVEGTAGSTTVTGDAFRSALGLRSNWFAVSGEPLTTVSGSATAAAVARRIPRS